MATKTNAELVKGLRDAADYLESRPDLAAYIVGGVRLDLFCNTKEDMAEVARAHAPLAKEYTDHYFTLAKKFSGEVSIEWNLNRERYCRLEVTVGTVTRPKVIVSEEMETVTVEHKKWVCDEEPLLAVGK